MPYRGAWARRAVRLAPHPFGPLTSYAAPCSAQFRHVLEYTERQRFKFKLSHWQCRDLVETLCRYDAKQRAKRLCDQIRLG